MGRRREVLRHRRRPGVRYSVDYPDRVSVDGVEIRVDMHLVGGRQLYSLLLEQVSYEIVVDLEGEQRNLYGVMVSGLRYQVRVQDERSRRLALADRNLRAPEGELVVKAPIPAWSSGRWSSRAR